jgi:hypothetical protein
MMRVWGLTLSVCYSHAVLPFMFLKLSFFHFLNAKNRDE